MISIRSFNSLLPFTLPLGVDEYVVVSKELLGVKVSKPIQCMWNNSCMQRVEMS